MKKIIKKMIVGILTAGLVFSITACGNKKEAEEETVSYNSAIEILNIIWENTEEDSRFSCYGGNTANPVMDSPAEYDVSDTDGLRATYLIPEDLFGNVDNAATLVHMMNANTFTGAVVHVKDIEVDEFVSKLKDSIMNNQFMCGFPERLVIVTAGDYVIYAFGAADLVHSYSDVACAKIDGAASIVDESME